MQIASRRSAGNFAGFTIDETTLAPSPEEYDPVAGRLAPLASRCPSPAPWHRSQVIPACKNGFPPHLLSVPGTGGCKPLLWQFRQSTNAGRFIGFFRASA